MKAETQLEKFERLIASLRKENQSLAAELDKCKCSIEEQIAKSSVLAEKNRNLEAELKKIQDKLKAQTDANAELKCQLEAANADCYKKLDASAIALAKCEKDNHSLQSSLTQSEKKNTDQEKKIQSLAKETEQLKYQLDSAAKKCGIEISDLRRIIADLKVSLKEKTEDCAKQLQELNSLQISHNQIKIKLDKCEAENLTHLSKIDYLTKRLESENRDDAECEKERKELELEAQRLKNELSKKIEVIAQLESKTSRLERDLSALQNQCSNKISALELELKNQRKECQAVLEKERNATNEALRKIEKLEEQIKKLQASLDAANKVRNCHFYRWH